MQMDRSDAEKLRVRTAEAWACALNEAEIVYSVLSGIDGFPDYIGRDLDVLISRKDARKALEVANDVGKRLGWDGVLIRGIDRDIWPWQIFFVKKEDDALLWLEIDLIQESTMFMGAAPFFDDFAKMIASRDSCNDPFSTNKIGHYAKSQLRSICYGEIERFGTKSVLDPISDPEVEAYLKKTLGERCARDYIARVRSGPEAVKGIGSGLKWTINSRFFLRHPLKWIWNVYWTRVVRPWNLYWKSSGLVFAIVWPEGQRNAQALDEAEAYFNGCFTTRRVRFSEPARAGADSAGKSEPAGLLKRWWHACAWLVRLMLTYYGRDRFLPRSVIQFVIYDGSPGDMLRHPQRYGMSGGSETQWLRRLAPWPVEIKAWRSEECDADSSGQISSNSESDKEGSPTHRQFTPLTGKEIAQAMVASLENTYAIQNTISFSD